MPAAIDDLAHLLKRCGYLTTPALLQAWSGYELDQAVDKVLDFSVNPADTFTLTGGDDWVRTLQLRRWWLDRMASVPAPLQERLAFFWHGHFATSTWKIGDARLMLDQNRVFRANAGGSFHTLTQQVIFGVAMIEFLDNQENTKWGPNENLARELMELFTLGVDQGYTQNDVVEVARALTGYGVQWHNDGSPNTYQFWPDAHDTGNKTIFGITQNWDGPAVVTEIINGSRRAICARWIARKLWSFFAYPNPDSTLLDSLTSTLVGANMDIGTFLRSMFLRTEFYSAAAKQGLVRTPTEWAVKLHQATGLQLAVTEVDYSLSDMGHCPLEPPNVAGWKQNEYWLTENAVWLKDEAAQAIAWKAIDAGFITDYASLSTPALVQRALDVFGLRTVASSTRSALENWLTAHRAANASNTRYHLLRLVALSPDFSLA